jgi:hypothetical protein
MMEPKETLTLLGIVLTFSVAFVNLIYAIVNNKKTAFVNTVTASRLKWIESLRDKVSGFISVTVRILNPEMVAREQKDMNVLLRERDTLMHQIILHLNPDDPEDQTIRRSVELVKQLTDRGAYTPDLEQLLLDLRNATQVYLKKEWTRVKRESKSGEQR